MQDDEGVDQVVAAGFDRAVVEKVARLVRINEYKRRQSPVGIRVSYRGFGPRWLRTRQTSLTVHCRPL